MLHQTTSGPCSLTPHGSWLAFDAAVELPNYVSRSGDNAMDRVEGMTFIENIDGLDIFTSPLGRFELTEEDQFSGSIVAISNSAH